MIAYKLVRLMSDGSLASLFIGKKARLPLNKWLLAEELPTVGFAIRKGWHCTKEKKAPHLSTRGRVWVKVEVEKVTEYPRPESQGGTWLLAERMKILNIESWEN